MRIQIVKQDKLPSCFKNARVSYWLSAIHCKETAIAAAVGVATVYKQSIGKKGSLGIYLYEYAPMIGRDGPMWQVCELQAISESGN